MYAAAFPRIVFDNVSLQERGEEGGRGGGKGHVLSCYAARPHPEMREEGAVGGGDRRCCDETE